MRTRPLFPNLVPEPSNYSYDSILMIYFGCFYIQNEFMIVITILTVTWAIESFCMIPLTWLSTTLRFYACSPPTPGSIPITCVCTGPPMSPKTPQTMSCKSKICSFWVTASTH